MFTFIVSLDVVANSRLTCKLGNIVFQNQRTCATWSSVDFEVVEVATVNSIPHFLSRLKTSKYDQYPLIILEAAASWDCPFRKAVPKLYLRCIFS